jgi:hypothetical protein
MPEKWEINSKRCTVLRTGKSTSETVCFAAPAVVIDYVLNYGTVGDELLLDGAPTTVVDLIRQRDYYRMVYENTISWEIVPENGRWAVYANSLHHFAGGYQECLNEVTRLATTGERVRICDVEYSNPSEVARDARVFSGQIRHLHPDTERVPLGVVEPMTELR